MTCLQCLEVQQSPMLLLRQVKPCIFCICTVPMCSSPPGKIKCVLAVFAFDMHSMWQWYGRKVLVCSLFGITMASELSCSPASPSLLPYKLAVPSLLNTWSWGFLTLSSHVATPH